ncbi:MAG TPA: molybdopterin molybdotransferase MoeA, partial [Chitinolyticbacter sp.]|nr:molybdopterin molybdotransferase MoeA [Chitinolyticbacter sp.]
MLTVEHALEQLTAAARRITETERLLLTQALGRVLAHDLISPLAVPGFDNSAMDGYALNVPDYTAPAMQYAVTQRIAAGEVGQPLQAGEAARIFTGAPIPPGTTAVVMQEDCSVADGIVAVAGSIRPGQHIRRAGEDVALHSVAVAAGTRLSAAHLGLIASLGIAAVEVLRPLRVALLCTGDELVEPGQPLSPGQIYNSNRYLLVHLLQALGCAVTDYGIVLDDRELTIRVLREAAEAHDVVLSTGGVSVGEEDHVRAALETHD